MLALAFTSPRDFRTVAVGLNDPIGQDGICYEEMMASAVAESMPTMVAFSFLQRQIVEALTTGATEG